ncbi:hypothetical protein DL96DRAFT_1561533 [Flagelloscypha sp. PMI_526]|nr:hypothetical protein DL96DRAFT_1561533 [Flagelloscypha sp. PMI_526]
MTDDEIRAGLELAKKIKRCNRVCQTLLNPSGLRSSFKNRTLVYVPLLDSLQRRVQPSSYCPEGGQGGKGIDMVVNIGKVLGGDWDYVEEENPFGVALVKTSTGYGSVKGQDGKYSYQGATLHHLVLMRKRCPPTVQIKAAGGVRTFGDVLRVCVLGVGRISATATESILEEAKKRGIIKDEPVEIEVEFPAGFALPKA